jgi:hypothetical protein
MRKQQGGMTPLVVGGGAVSRLIIEIRVLVEKGLI